MNEEVVGDKVFRTITYVGNDGGRIQATTKAVSYFLSYPPALFSTKIVFDMFVGGTHKIRIERNLFSSEVASPGLELDLSVYVGRVDFVDVLDYIHSLKSRIVTLQGWKGKDELSIERESLDSWVVKEHRTDNNSGVVKESCHLISHGDVLDMWSIITVLCDCGERTRYRDLVRELIGSNGIVDADQESFNGGKNRSAYYFPLYYYPLKILEYLQFVQYHGRGGVTRLEDDVRELK